MAPKSLIYTISCSCHPEQGVRYVGQTSKGLVARKGVHLWTASHIGGQTRENMEARRVV